MNLTYRAEAATVEFYVILRFQMNARTPKNLLLNSVGVLLNFSTPALISKTLPI